MDVQTLATVGLIFSRPILDPEARNGYFLQGRNAHNIDNARVAMACACWLLALEANP